MEERRKFVRLDTRLPVRYRVLPAAHADASALSDLSGGGLCLFVRDPLTPGARLEVEVTLPGRPRPILFTGEVVWCEQYDVVGRTVRSRSIEAGLKFVSIAPEDQQAITRYVSLSLQPPSAS